MLQFWPISGLNNLKWTFQFNDKAIEFSWSCAPNILQTPIPTQIYEQKINVMNCIKLMISKQTLALRQASEESACFLLSFFCDV